MCQGLANETGRRGWRRIEECVYGRSDVYKHGCMDADTFVADNGGAEWGKVKAWLSRLLAAREGLKKADEALGAADCDTVELHGAVGRLSALAYAASDVLVWRFQGSAAQFKDKVRRLADGRLRVGEIPW